MGFNSGFKGLTQTNKTLSSHTICRAHWGWRWDFRIFVV